MRKGKHAAWDSAELNISPGQQRLKSARILIVGAGGLGCPAAAYLAGAGVGTLGVVDGDVVESSNLHRQIAHGTSRVGAWKVDSLVSYCKEYGPFLFSRNEMEKKEEKKKEKKEVVMHKKLTLLQTKPFTKVHHLP